jgi:hypothetical protein
VTFLRLVPITDGLYADKYFEVVFWWMTPRGNIKHQNVQSTNNSPSVNAIFQIPYQGKKGYLAMFIIFANWYS